MNSPMTMKYEIQEDPLKVRLWIHASDGSTVARFDARFGIDIHHSITDQLSGASQCLHCTHSKPTLSDWNFFREKARELWGLDIDEGLVNL